jgi:hypothetical protein
VDESLPAAVSRPAAIIAGPRVVKFEDEEEEVFARTPLPVAEPPSQSAIAPVVMTSSAPLPIHLVRRARGVLNGEWVSAVFNI